MPGVSFQSRAEAVGHDEDALASVGRSEVVSTHHERPSGVARLLQISDDAVGPESSESRHVLSDDPMGSHFSHQPEELRPEPSLVVVSAPLSGNADGLTWKSSDQSVSCGEIDAAHRHDVAEARNVRPVLLKDSLTELISFHLCNATPSGPL